MDQLVQECGGKRLGRSQLTPLDDGALALGLPQAWAQHVEAEMRKAHIRNAAGNPLQLL
jgi:hypothetical protein